MKLNGPEGRNEKGRNFWRQENYAGLYFDLLQAPMGEPLTALGCQHRDVFCICNIQLWKSSKVVVKLTNPYIDFHPFKVAVTNPQNYALPLKLVVSNSSVTFCARVFIRRVTIRHSKWQYPIQRERDLLPFNMEDSSPKSNHPSFKAVLFISKAICCNSKCQYPIHLPFKAIVPNSQSDPLPLKVVVSNLKEPSSANKNGSNQIKE